MKALRLYDENGLLPPARVDPDSGYRFYRVEQIRAATLVGLLRAAGIPLVEIRRVLDDPTSARVDEYEAALTDELAERRRVLAYVRRFLKEEQMFEVQVKQVQEQPYVSRSKRVRVPELGGFIDESVRQLRAEHEPTGHFVLYHGQVDEEADGPVEVCLPTRHGEKRLPAGEVAYTIATGEETEFPAILGAYDAVAKWAKAQGRQLAGPPREINDYEEGQTPRMEIAWPII
ncbi:MAG: MerR family transcriptional regulator [Actinobacteria bacterium]|nr:MerR family transcriptional regulator [Actinomycetota bacterium]